MVNRPTFYAKRETCQSSGEPANDATVSDIKTKGSLRCIHTYH